MDSVPCNPTNNFEHCLQRRSVCSTTLSPNNRCVQCGTNTDCVGFPGPIKCSQQTSLPNFCANCDTDPECGAGFECKNFKCWQCSNDDDCHSMNKGYCEKTFERKTENCLSSIVEVCSPRKTQTVTLVAS